MDRANPWNLRSATAGIAAVLAGAVGACGGSDPPAAEPRLDRGGLTVYLSTPRAGDSADQARAVVAGARLALEDAGGRAGGEEVAVVELDSSATAEGLSEGPGWDPDAVAQNAAVAAADPTAIAYIGELDLGGSAVSVPITNGAGILQISPGDGLTSLTRQLPGAGGPGPERYYPSGKRSFLRLVPVDFLQASALVAWARAGGARRLAVLHDGGLFGGELAEEVAVAASCGGLRVEAQERAGGDIAAYPALAERLAGERPEAVIYAGQAGEVAEPLLAAIGREVPRARLLGAGGVANEPPPPAGGPDALVDGGRADRAVLVTRPMLPPTALAPAGRRALERIAAEERRPVPVDALYGYEAMALVLDAIDAAGEPGRAKGDLKAAVRERALEPRVRSSVLGAYRIDAQGDVSEHRFAGYRRDATGLTFAGVRRPLRELAPPTRELAEPEGACGWLLRRAAESQ